MIINQKFKEIEDKKDEYITMNDGVIDIGGEQFYGRAKNIIKMLKKELEKQILIKGEEFQKLTDDEKLDDEDYYHYIEDKRLMENLEKYVNKKGLKENDVIGLFWYEMTDSLELYKRLDTLSEINYIHEELLESIEDDKDYVKKYEIEENLEMDL